MVYQRYVLLLVLGTLICWGAWVIVLFNIDPSVAGPLGLTSFSLSLFLALLGTFSLIGFVARRAFAKSVISFDHVGVSIRQGFFLSIIVVGALLLKGAGLFVWWSVILLVAGVSVLEFFFLTRDTDAQQAE